MKEHDMKMHLLQLQSNAAQTGDYVPQQPFVGRSHDDVMDLSVGQSFINL
jgi:hypothetical protein